MVSNHSVSSAFGETLSPLMQTHEAPKLRSPEFEALKVKVTLSCDQLK
jgi:hypothetical protein